MLAEERVAIDVGLALEDKWRAGREKYGPVWAGGPALVEAHDDALDVVNYLNRARQDRVLSDLEHELLIRQALVLVEGIRACLRPKGGLL